ncbi:MAG: hypothetical protein KME31_34420 [Tolypothrix carrinoi HA7290-LM1]|jgi:hypothetical protein|nr:hypothetical protein [Tolypothrix carrinoi HA7290-LM1]
MAIFFLQTIKQPSSSNLDGCSSLKDRREAGIEQRTEIKGLTTGNFLINGDRADFEEANYKIKMKPKINHFKEFSGLKACLSGNCV